MWNPVTISAITAAAIAVIGAVGNTIIQIMHARNPGAHGGQGHGQVPS